MSHSKERPQSTALLETLEPRLLLAVAAEEQLFVYLLNRARHDPATYQQEANLSVSLSGIAAQPPLAVNDNLFASAQFHAKEMARYNYFDHISHQSWIMPNRMARNAGYDLPAVFRDDENSIESIAGGTMTAEGTLKLLIEDIGVPGAGHRAHLLATNSFFQSHREIGVGHGFNYDSAYWDYWTIHTAYRTTPNQFLTGVIFSDLDLDGRYDLNEGLGGITITMDGTPFTTNTAGGYSIPASAGTHNLTVQGGGFIGTATAAVNMANQNVEVDFLSGQATGVINFGGGSPGTPAAPAVVAASDGTFVDKVQIAWTPAQGAASYEVWRHTANDSSAAAIIGTPTGTSYDDASAVAGTHYFYWVKAKNAIGTSGFSVADPGRRNATPIIAGLAPLPDTLPRGASLQLTATGVADSDGTVSRVQFYRDVNSNGTYEAATDTLLGAGKLSAGAWSWSGSTSKFPYGTVGLLARAVDNNGAWGDPAVATITVTNPDPDPPTATVAAATDIEASPGAKHLFQIQYADNMVVDASDIGAGDIRVTGPGSFSALARFVSASSRTDAATITATYALTAPGGAWDAADNGTYTVLMEPNQVSDWNDNWVVAPNPDSRLGTFDVNLPNDGDQTPTLGKVTLLTPMVPGDRASVSVIVRNIGGAKATGTSVDKLYLSPQPDDLTGAILLGTKTSTVNLGPGQTRTVTFSFTVPGTAAAGTYYIVADVNTGASSPDDLDLRLDNNRVATGAQELVWRFGNVATRKNVKVVLPDGDGTLVTFGLTGPGTGTVALNAGALDVALAGTTARSAATVTTRKTAAPGDDGEATLGAVTVGDAGNPADQTSLKSFTARTGNLAGDFTVMGSLAGLTLDDVSGDRLIDIRNVGGATGAVALAFDRVADLSVTSAMPIRSLTATEWLDAGSNDTFQAPSVGTLTIRGNRRLGFLGNFEADLVLTNELAAQSLATMTVAGWLKGSVTSARSAIGSVTVGGLQDSAIFAGVDNSLMQLPDPATDFDLETSIRSVTVRGIDPAAPSTINSHLAAANLGTISLVGVQFENGVTPFGLAAHTLKRLTWKNGGTSYVWPNTDPAEPTQPLPNHEFEVRLA